MVSFERACLKILGEAFDRLEAGFADLPPAGEEVDSRAVREVLLETADRMLDNFPYHHPLYAGQMLKPPHAIARLAYALAMWLNPNNHALDGGRASSAMEREAVAQIARMVGWDEHLGHLTGGGTVANLEALWVAGRLRPGETVVVSSMAHYTHERIGGVLGLEVETVEVDRHGRLDPERVEDRLRQGGVGTVVATLGTTATGSIDPLPALLDLRERYGFRLHLDAAYGGYFALVGNLAPEDRASFDAMAEADSIVVDPHKHGLQPYGCGCVVFRDPAVGRLYRHDSPYTYFTSRDLHLGEISLECSRPGAAAVALWATQRLLPLEPGGEFARGLEAGREAALALHAGLSDAPPFRVALPPALDIVVYSRAGRDAEELSRRNRALFRAAAECDLHLALATLPADLLRPWWPDLDRDPVCLRSCLMKPEHRAWTGEIVARLKAAAAVV